MSKIFGGSKSKSVNSNKGIINSAFQPLIGQATASNGQLSAFLGGDGTQFQRFADAAGFDFERARGEDAIGSASSGRGVFRSGARDKGIEEFRQGLSGRYAQQYIQSLLGQTQSSLGAGGLVAGAGQESTSKSKPGIGAFLGQVGAGVAGSDERLKTDLVPVGINADGITVYQYKYKGNDAVFTGVMAQEVAEKRPDALGPRTNSGHMSVDYSKINIIDRD